ncbi:MAG: alpha/beta fold hydrolase [Clostridia bacterium]|nr:alpha/beta fold hydrolase [Clostridia bacterium]
MKIIEKSVLSTDKIHYLKGKLYVPDGDIKGYFHVVHGMTEHIGRYDNFLTVLAENGYLSFAYDNLGHGNTATCKEELGYIAKKDGYNYLVNDVGAFYNAVYEEYGDHPYYLMGHSMGSFIVRLAITKSVMPTKAIIMGTGGKNPLANVGLSVIKVLKVFCGEKHVSKLIDKMAFGSYNNAFKSENHKRSWLTSDKDIWAKYDADPFCNYRFTLSAMHDLITMNKNCNLKPWFESVSDKLPIFLVSGTLDPVGENGKAVTWVYETLKSYGKNASLKLYEGARHEILNDFCKEQVILDILEFISK